MPTSKKKRKPVSTPLTPQASSSKRRTRTARASSTPLTPQASSSSRRTTRSSHKKNKNNGNTTTSSPKKKRKNTPQITPRASPTPFTPSLGLDEIYGRDVSVFQISEKGTSYIRPFYRTTGTGNGRFEHIFVGALVPFYGKDEKNTIRKAIMVRNGRNTLFEWQKDLLEYLKKIDTIEMTVFEAFTTFLDNYINTPGELMVSFAEIPSPFRLTSAFDTPLPSTDTFFWNNPYHRTLLESIQKYFVDNFSDIIVNIYTGSNAPPPTAFELDSNTLGYGNPNRTMWNHSRHFLLQKATPIKYKKKLLE